MTPEAEEQFTIDKLRKLWRDETKPTYIRGQALAALCLMESMKGEAPDDPRSTGD